MSSSQHPSLTVKIIREVEAWDAIEHHWEKLYAATPGASTSLDFRWLRTWWRVYGPTYGGHGLRIVTVWREARLVGAVPLFLARGAGGSGLRSLRMLSTGEAEQEETCADYLDLLSVPGETAACARLIWDEVRHMNWDCLELLDLSEDSPLVEASGAHQWFDRGSCPIADLTGGFESYLQKLSANTRQQVRRLIRTGERANARFELVAESQADEAFEELIALHQHQWTTKGQPGVFAAPRFVQFHRSLLRDWLPRGRAVLARLSVAGSPVVVIYGFLTGKKFDFYQSGMRQERSESLGSPGILAHVLLMNELTGRGVEAYDFLRGSSLYKERLATRTKQLVGIRIWRPTLTAMRHRLSGWLVGSSEGRAGFSDRGTGRAVP
jgi:CelD/BcsL family acetyltransferase involved in cellulose biosynthesis